MRAEQERMTEDLHDLAADMQEIKGRMALLMQTTGRHEERFARIELRLKRIEHRLDLRD